MFAKRLMLISVLISLAMALHAVERLLPVPVPMPGVKLGLANTVTLVGVYILALPELVLLVVARTFLGSLFGGGMSAFFFSISGGLLSLVGMLLLVRLAGRFLSVPTISMAGAIFHNLGQLLAAALIVRTLGIIFYLPVLMLSAIVTGLATGIASRGALIFLRRAGYIRNSYGSF